MKVIVCGGRHLPVTDTWVKRVGDWLLEKNATAVLCGGANGGDHIGELAAMKHDIAIEYCPAAWGVYGKSAGPRRNQQMADRADMCLALPGGRGTADMVKKMLEAKKPVEVLVEGEK